jgi:hypothetical protein
MIDKKIIVKILSFLKEILSNIIAVSIENKIISGASILKDIQSFVIKGIFLTIDPTAVFEKFSRIRIKILMNKIKLKVNLNLSSVNFGKFLR